MKIAHVEVSSIVPPMVNSRMLKNILEKDAGNVPKSTLLRNIPKAKEERIKEIMESLKLHSVESWNEQQQW